MRGGVLMRILALDTATELCSVAVLLEAELVQHEQRLERGHAEAILPMVDAALREAGVELRSLDAIAFGRGPGAFTGVRLAASVTQGLAFGTGLPVVPVSDLKAVAQRALDEDGGAHHVLVCADARMREVYSGCFERSGEGFARPADEERVSPPADVRLPDAWRAKRPSQAGEPCGGGLLLGVGSGFAEYPELRTGLGIDAFRMDLRPRAAEIARLAAPEVAHRRFLPAQQALPMYLRDDVTGTPRAASRD